MPKLDDTARLRHMLIAARKARDFAAGRKHKDLESDELLAHGFVRLLEIVGEAASRISPQRRKELRDIPWPLITGMRNRLVHGYDTVDLDVLWKTIEHDLPPLIEALEKALA